MLVGNITFSLLIIPIARDNLVVSMLIWPSKCNFGSIIKPRYFRESDMKMGQEFSCILIVKLVLILSSGITNIACDLERFTVSLFLTIYVDSPFKS